MLLVAAKLLLPTRMAQVNQVLSEAMERNMDVKAVFSAVGEAFSGEKDASDTMKDVYQAVFHPAEEAEVLETAVLLPPVDAAMETLQTYRAERVPVEKDGAAVGPPETEEQQQVASLAYVLYSDQNLPECVSMEQAILDFSYCTPVNGTLTSDFGYRDHPTEGEDRFHYGVDLAADTGTEVLSFAGGTVSVVGESSSYGKYCMVSHSGGYSTLYAHCSRITVSSGTAVKKGQKIAEVGETGIATGPHLHFEVQCSGTYLNPIYYVSTL